MDGEKSFNHYKSNPFNFLEHKSKEELKYILCFYGINSEVNHNKESPVEDIMHDFYRNVSDKVGISINDFSYGNESNGKGRLRAFDFCIKANDPSYRIIRHNDKYDYNKVHVDFVEWTILIDVLLSTVSAVESAMNEKVSLHKAIINCGFGSRPQNYQSSLSKKLTQLISEDFLNDILSVSKIEGSKKNTKRGRDIHINSSYNIARFQNTLICNLAKNYSFFSDFIKDKDMDIDINRIIKYYNEMIDHCNINEIEMFECIFNIRLIYDIFNAIEKAVTENSNVNVRNIINLFSKAKYIPATLFRSYFITESVRAISFNVIKDSTHYNDAYSSSMDLVHINTSKDYTNEIENIWYKITDIIITYSVRYTIPLIKAQLAYFLFENFSNDYVAMYDYLIKSEFYKAITEKKYKFKTDYGLLKKACKDSIITYIKSEYASPLVVINKTQERGIITSGSFNNVNDCIKYIRKIVLPDFNDVKGMKNQIQSDWVLNPNDSERIIMKNALLKSCIYGNSL